MKAKCDKCGYEWDTRSTHVFVSCPSCLAKIKVPVVENGTQKEE